MLKISKGKFIVFEGIDGSGQSTQVNLLVDYLSRQGIKVLKTKEPTTDSPYGSKIREVLRGEQKANSKLLQELFVQDRKWHIGNIILPAIARGETVISDRYLFSTLAYGMSDGLDSKWLFEMNKNFPIPDLLFFINTKPETAVARIDQRGIAKQLFEKKEKLEIVYCNYHLAFKMFSNLAIYFINGEESISNVFENIKNIIKKSYDIHN